VGKREDGGGRGGVSRVTTKRGGKRASGAISTFFEGRLLPPGGSGYVWEMEKGCVKKKKEGGGLVLEAPSVPFKE